MIYLVKPAVFTYSVSEQNLDGGRGFYSDTVLLTEHNRWGLHSSPQLFFSF